MEGISNTLYKISKWGKANPWKARIIITLSHLLLFPMAFLTGTLLRDTGLIFDRYWLTGAVVCCAVLFLFYPRKRHTSRDGRHAAYWRQKRFDFGVLAAGWLGLMLIANRDFQDVASVPSVFAVTGASVELSPPQDAMMYGAKEIASANAHEKPLVLQSKKEKRKAMREQIREVRKDGELSSTAKAILVLLIIGLSAALWFGMASLSCTLSCNGQEGAALLVMLLGTVGAICLLIFGIRGVVGRKRNKQPVDKPDEQPVS